MKKITSTVNFVFVLALLGALGCVTAEKKTESKKIEKLEAGEKMPFIEAYIEYLGPNEKWAGPSTFLLHVSAPVDLPGNEEAEVQIEVIPELLEAESPPVLEPTQKKKKDKEVQIQNRVLASKNTEKMSKKIAQAHLNELALAIQKEDVPFEACLSPLKVRITRMDGKVLEKEGCRGVEGWPKKVSEVVSQFLEEKLKK